MKTKRKIWLYWWLRRVAYTDGTFGEAHVYTTYTKKLDTASRMQAFHKETGDKVGRMRKMQVEVEDSL